MNEDAKTKAEDDVLSFVLAHKPFDKLSGREVNLILLVSNYSRDAALKKAENTIEQIRLRLSMASFENRLGESVVNEVTDDELKRLRGKE